MKRAWTRSTPYAGAVPAAVKRAVLRRDVDCQVCRLRPAVEVDHVVPASLGGSDAPTNLQGICRSCHQSKTAAESLAALRRRQAGGRLPPERHPGLL